QATTTKEFIPARSGATGQAEPAQAITLEQTQEFEADFFAFDLYQGISDQHPALSAWLNASEESRALMSSEFLMIFHLLHMVEKRLPQFREVSTHPSALERVTMLAKYHMYFLSKGGASEQEIMNDPLVGGFRKHIAMLNNSY